MLNIVLFEPEIPPNTGNIIRLCANSGFRLHIIEPMGFVLQDRLLRRAGLDYHEFTTLITYPHWDNFIKKNNLMPANRDKLYALTTSSQIIYSQVHYQVNDYLVFGPETRGLPKSLLADWPSHQKVRIPMLPHSRSLNLSNAVSILIYEAWRQLNYSGALRTTAPSSLLCHPPMKKQSLR